MCKWWITYFLIASFLSLVVASQYESSICKSITVRSVQDLKKLQNCTVVTGHVRLVLMDLTPEELASLKPLNVEEITQYLLVYRVNGLDSLERIFPKLVVIRGTTLLYDQYGLVVLENRNMENIGLIALLRVLRGSVRIESNPSLCYTHTVNWVSILSNTTKKYHYVIKDNKSPNYCPLCYRPNPTEEEIHQHCWSMGKLQQLPLADYTDHCPTDCPSKKCNKKGQCCTGNCLTSCSDDNCQYCTNRISDKKCVKNCHPTNVLVFKRQCAMDCHQYGLIRLAGECVEKCPKFYREIQQHGIVTTCSLDCIGNFTIKTPKDLEGFNDCTTLQGSLTLELTNVNQTNIDDLDSAFSKLREITGYLKVVRSPQLVSLNFLRNLHTISGTSLIDNKYALYVVDNYHLEEIWNLNQKVSIPKGHIFFHLNPHLCYYKIMALKPQLKESSISIMDVSQNSNGERLICGESVRILNATIEAFNANEARIVTDIIPLDLLPALLGYVYFYKEAPQQNVTRYDGRHGCGQDNWYMDYVVTTRRRYVLRNLKPDTQYAFFVQTLTMTTYIYQIEAASKIQYFRTAAAKPGPVAKIYYHSLSINEIEIHWWPPRQANGVLEKYIIQYREAKINQTILPTDTKNPQQIEDDICHCPKLETESGPFPIEEDFYEQEPIVYDQALYNFIYVPNKAKKVRKNLPPPSNDIQQKIQRIQESAVNASIEEQDEGRELFEITPILPLCPKINASTSYTQENNCANLEYIKADYEVPGDTHTFILKQLQPGVTYRISIRACVKDLANGCGPETILWAETVSKRLETILDSLRRPIDTGKVL